MIRTFNMDNCRVTIKDTPELRAEVFRKVLGFYLKHESFSGECIMQFDAPLIDGPTFLSDLADETFKFDVSWEDDIDE